MTGWMTLDRFATLADAYGGTVARWPERERDAALAIAREPAAAAILARAQDLDAALDAWRVPAPSAHLRAALSGAIPARTGTGRGRAWWSGVGLAAVLAGATAGAAAVAMIAPIDAASDTATSFGDLGVREG